MGLRAAALIVPVCSVHAKPPVVVTCVLRSTVLDSWNVSVAIVVEPPPPAVVPAGILADAGTREVTGSCWAKQARARQSKNRR